MVEGLVLIKQFQYIHFKSLNLTNMRTTFKNYFGLLLLITAMVFTLKAIQFTWFFLAHVL